MRSGLLLASALIFCTAAGAAPWARFETSMGVMVLELESEKASASVKNFIRYAKEGHFDGTVFYRVIPGFIIQAGSYKARGVYVPAKHAAVPLESGNGLSNVRGAVAMARGDAPKSGRAEFFINLADYNATGLDPKPADAPNTTGYAVFAHVVQGMEVADQIAAVPTGGGKGPFPDAEPKTPVTILKVTIEDTPPAPPPPAPGDAAAPDAAVPDASATQDAAASPDASPSPAPQEPATPDAQTPPAQ